MHDHVEEFCAAMREAGLEPPMAIESGHFIRFPGVGKANGNTAGWYFFFEDGLGGVFGDFSSGLDEKWQARHDRPYAADEKREFARRVASARAQANAERTFRHAEAATRAEDIWNSATPAPADYPYLVRKSVKAHGARVHEGKLVIPMRNGTGLRSLQFIGDEKRFLEGGQVAGTYFGIGSPSRAQTLCITEGFATGATVHEATGHPVAVAFTAGNLLAVARALHERYPVLRLVICADDDTETEDNPGVAKARAAAQGTGALIAVPDFGPERPVGMSDFNDMARLLGPEAVARRISDAESVLSPVPVYADSTEEIPEQDDQTWPEPQPLGASIEPAPYPVDALPKRIREVVLEVQAFTQAPVALVAASAIAAVSLALQALVDSKRSEGLSSPVSLFLLTIADSGERKSTADQFFTRAIREYQDEEAQAAKPELAAFAASMSAWDVKRRALVEGIGKATKTGKSTDQYEHALCDHESDKPLPPRVPRLLRGDETPENLAWVLAKEWPSGGVMSAEAGVVLGAHGMGKDSLLRNLALLNILWDGGELPIGRKTSESFTVRGARLTIGLQVQAATLRSFFERTGELARGTGFLARFLVAWPVSTQGSRPFREAPASWPALTAFDARLRSLLARPVPMEDSGALAPPCMPLAPDAKRAWVAFHDQIESELGAGGELYDVRDVASKVADNAARLATLFEVFETDAVGAVSEAALVAATRIAAWHLLEARRFFGELVLPQDLADAQHLTAWLVARCRREGTKVVSRRDVQRNVTPVRLRRSPVLDEALTILAEAAYVRLAGEGLRKDICVNPALFREVSS